jgi:hypothetical protein
MVIIIIAIILSSIIPGFSHAFNPEEHEYISENAFEVSLAMAEEHGFINEKEAAKLRSCFLTDREMNYGRLSAIVDNVLSPSQYIKLYGIDNDKCDGLDSERAKLQLLLQKKEGLFAARSNYDHFGERTLTEFAEFHDLARVQAANGNLALALAINAFAVHYLEDFFAPGHLFTPRTEVNNITSRMLHDKFNREGATIDVTLNPDLRSYLELIKKEVSHVSHTEAGVDEISNGQPIMFKGDDQLLSESDDPDLKKQLKQNDKLKKQPGQKELIIAEVAKTITNIFKAYHDHGVSKSFNSNFIEEYTSSKQSMEVGGGFDDVSYTSETFRGFGSSLALEITPYVSAPFEKDFNARLGFETVLATYPVYWFNSESSLLEKILLGGGYGYDVTFDPFNYQSYSHGPMFKYQVDIKKWDIGFTAYVKYKFNHENGNNFRSWPVGIRVTHELDYLSIFIGLGDEPRFTDKQVHVLTGYAGVTFHVPLGVLGSTVIGK